MNLVLSGPIDDALTQAVASLVEPSRSVPLHANAIRLEGAGHDARVRTNVAALCDAARVDHAFVEENVRWADFRLLALDMDSTLITVECIDELAAYAGKKSEVAAITEAAMRGEIADFAESLRRRVALLKGLPVSMLERTLAERVRLTAGAVDLLAAARAAAMKTVLVSGGFTYFACALGQRLGFDIAAANTLEIDQDLLTGRVEGPIIDAAGKAAEVLAAADRFSLERSEILAIGDGANDIPMLKAAARSVAFHAKPVVRSVATEQVRFGGLDTVLDYYEGATIVRHPSCDLP